MKKKLTIFNNPAYWYTILWMMYYMGGILYSFGSIISTLILVVLLVVSFYHMYLCFNYKDNPKMLKGVTLITFLITFYGIFRLMGPSYFGIQKFLFQKNVYMTVLPVYSFYYFTRNGYLTVKDMKLFTFVFVVFIYLVYLNDIRTRSMVTGGESGDMTVNSGYNFIGLLPFVFLFKKKPALFFSLLLYIWFFTIFCMKRGAIISGIAATLILFLHYFRESKKGAKISALIIIGVFAVFIVFYVQGMMDNNAYFALRYEHTMEGDASGREEMYPKYINYLLHENTAIKLLVGGGLDYSLLRFEEGTHSDWFQIAIDMGLMGVFCYIYYWGSFIKSIGRMRRIKGFQAILLMIFIMDFLKSIFSFSITNRPIVTTCILGFCLAAPYVIDKDNF